VGLQEESKPPFESLATGNWGCGVFGGNVQLKAVLQWMAASEGKMSVRYFPFNEPVGPQLQEFTEKLVKANVTVGALWKSLMSVSDGLASGRKFTKDLLNTLLDLTLGADSTSAGSG